MTMFLFPTADHNIWYYTMNELQETVPIGIPLCSVSLKVGYRGAAPPYPSQPLNVIHDSMWPDVGQYGVVNVEDYRFLRLFCACEQ